MKVKTEHMYYPEYFKYQVPTTYNTYKQKLPWNTYMK